MFNNKTILITGGTGSFGKELVKVLLSKFNLKKIIIYSRDEFKQYEMSKTFNNKCMRYFIGDVRDYDRLDLAFKNVDYVVHAAALKQVNTAEYNPSEYIKTNIIGAENIIKASINNNVKKIIALSTDKASNPINLYGATKLVSDKLFSSANNIVGKKKIAFSIVRYGNVINSRGSVIPYFKDLIKKNNNFFPITDKEMTRFLITLDDAVKFVINSFKIMKGGEIIVPKIPSIKITDLAKTLNKNYSHKIIGIRPGEKIHEQMSSKDESQNIIEFNKYFIICPTIEMNVKKNFKINANGERGKKVKKNFILSSENFLIENKKNPIFKKIIN